MPAQQAHPFGMRRYAPLIRAIDRLGEVRRRALR
jgi:hypothetical protein